MEPTTSNNLNEFRTRILYRLRNPCAGRFDPAWDVESEFLQNVSDYSVELESLFIEAEQECDDITAYSLAGLIEELAWANKTVRAAWVSQDKGILRSRNKAPKAVQPSTTLLDF